MTGTTKALVERQLDEGLKPETPNHYMKDQTVKNSSYIIPEPAKKRETLAPPAWATTDTGWDTLAATDMPVRSFIRQLDAGTPEVTACIEAEQRIVTVGGGVAIEQDDPEIALYGDAPHPIRIPIRDALAVASALERAHALVTDTAELRRPAEACAAPEHDGRGGGL